VVPIRSKRRIPAAARRAALCALALLLGSGCAGGLSGLFASKDPMQQEMELLAAEQKKMAERALMAEEASAKDRKPPTYEERLVRGDNYLATGRIAEALWEYSSAHRLRPEAAAPRVRLGYVHLRHEPERARPLFESALEIDPDYASAHTGLGLSLLAGDERRAGLRQLERGVELAPASARAQAALGVALDQTGDRERALVHLEKARDLAPRDGRILNNLAVAYLRAGQPARAEPLLRQALREDTRDQALRANNLGMALALQGDFEEALESFRRGGDEQAAHNNLGYAHFVRGEYERAIVEYERALVAGGNASVEVVRNLEAARRARREGGLRHERGVSRAGEAGEATPAEPGNDGEPQPAGIVAERPATVPPASDAEPDEPLAADDPWLRPSPPGKLDPDA